MELPRQDPDQLLRAICSDTYTRKSGKLKIFHHNRLIINEGL